MLTLFRLVGVYTCKFLVKSRQCDFTIFLAPLCNNLLCSELGFVAYLVGVYYVVVLGKLR